MVVEGNSNTRDINPVVNLGTKRKRAECYNTNHPKKELGEEKEIDGGWKTFLRKTTRTSRRRGGGKEDCQRNQKGECSRIIFTHFFQDFKKKQERVRGREKTKVGGRVSKKGIKFSFHPKKKPLKQSSKTQANQLRPGGVKGFFNGPSPDLEEVQLPEPLGKPERESW